MQHRSWLDLGATQRGALWMLLASLGFAGMGALVKLGSEHHFSAAELVFYRSLLSLLMVYALIVWRKQSLRTQYVRTHVQRSLAGTAALMTSFYTLSRLPLATASTLQYTSALFLALLTVVVYRKRPPLPVLLAIGLGFLGVVSLLKPTFSSQNLSAALVGLLSGLLAALAYVNVKTLGKLGEPGWRVVFYFTLTATLAAGGLMLFDRFHAIDTRGALILLGLGVTGTLGQTGLTHAYRQGKTLVVASLSYATVLFSALLGWCIWGNGLDLWSGLGMLLVVGSGVLSVLGSRED
ncbi:DMT family transporter [Leeia sp.]|uniref:DMT family transporter n=1 Tax=Leeia sp. TaxID=2884678 RepID=UPI0035B1341D